jgi:nucleoid-associated protein YgaU
MTQKQSRPDFSNVQGGQDVAGESAPAAPDFSNVVGGPNLGPGANARTYTVRSGDSLSKIAHRIYGHSRHWRLIFDANRDQLDNPDLIQPGQVLQLPPDPA